SLSAPLRPWALTSRPTRNCVWPGRGDLGVDNRLVVGVDDVDANASTIGESGDQGAERLRGATRTADHATEVSAMHTHLEHVTSRRTLGFDLHLVRVINDPLDQVLERRSEHAHALSASDSAAAESSAGASAVASAAGA